MTDLTQATPSNPAQEMKPGPLANSRDVRVTAATRVPMNIPNMKLAVPEIPGYYLYWHLGKDIPQALRAGYQFVDNDELDVEQRGVANDAAESGSTDLGTRISVTAGDRWGSLDEKEGFEAQRLYLMKLPDEFHQIDLKLQAERSEEIARAMRSGMVGVDPNDTDKVHRYMKKGQDLFIPKRPRP